MASRHELVKMKEAGLTYAEIGRRCGITREWVRQVITGVRVSTAPPNSIIKVYYQIVNSLYSSSTLVTHALLFFAVFLLFQEPGWGKVTQCLVGSYCIIYLFPF